MWHRHAQSLRLRWGEETTRCARLFLKQQIYGKLEHRMIYISHTIGTSGTLEPETWETLTATDGEDITERGEGESGVSEHGGSLTGTVVS